MLLGATRSIAWCCWLHTGRCWVVECVCDGCVICFVWYALYDILCIIYSLIFTNTVFKTEYVCVCVSAANDKVQRRATKLHHALRQTRTARKIAVTTKLQIIIENESQKSAQNLAQKIFSSGTGFGSSFGSCSVFVCIFDLSQATCDYCLCCLKPFCFLIFARFLQKKKLLSLLEIL